MSEAMTHTNRLVKVWLQADSGRRELLRRDWPDLAGCLDAVTWRPTDEMLMGSIPLPEIDVKAGLRDVLQRAGVPEDMIKKMTCDGCRTIERLRAGVPLHDEEAYYQFQRAERHHRRECPNR